MKAYGRDNVTPEEWIDNVGVPDNGIGFEKFEATGGIKKTVEFELREYETLEGDKESNEGRIYS